MLGLIELRRVLGTKQWLLYLLGMALLSVTGLGILITAVILLSWI
jgi:hypothetical protein